MGDCGRATQKRQLEMNQIRSMLTCARRLATPAV